MYKRILFVIAIISVLVSSCVTYVQSATFADIASSLAGKEATVTYFYNSNGTCFKASITHDNRYTLSELSGFTDAQQYTAGRYSGGWVNPLVLSVEPGMITTHFLIDDPTQCPPPPPGIPSTNSSYEINMAEVVVSSIVGTGYEQVPGFEIPDWILAHWQTVGIVGISLLGSFLFFGRKVILSRINVDKE